MKAALEILVLIFVVCFVCQTTTGLGYRRRRFASCFGHGCNAQCNPCSRMLCPYRQICHLVPDTNCATPPCVSKPTCILDPELNICPLGRPISNSKGHHLTCATKADCPKDTTCVTSTVSGVQVKKCCLDESKCKDKPGVCPISTDTSVCNKTCEHDGDCPMNSICCATACNGTKCVVPRPWYTNMLYYW